MTRVEIQNEIKRLAELLGGEESEPENNERQAANEEFRVRVRKGQRIVVIVKNASH